LVLGYLFGTVITTSALASALNSNNFHKANSLRPSQSQNKNLQKVIVLIPFHVNTNLSENDLKYLFSRAFTEGHGARKHKIN